jgi:hypothetical protein
LSAETLPRDLVFPLIFVAALKVLAHARDWIPCLSSCARVLSLASDFPAHGPFCTRRQIPVALLFSRFSDKARSGSSFPKAKLLSSISFYCQAVLFSRSVFESRTGARRDPAETSSREPVAGLWFWFRAQVSIFFTVPSFSSSDTGFGAKYASVPPARFLLSSRVEASQSKELASSIPVWEAVIFCRLGSCELWCLQVEVSLIFQPSD